MSVSVNVTSTVVSVIINFGLCLATTVCDSAAKATWAELCTCLTTPSSLFAGDFSFGLACASKVCTFVQACTAYNVVAIKISKQICEEDDDDLGDCFVPLP